MAILFLASGIRHHLPSLCSCPIPAIRYFPSGVKVSELTKPVIFISNKGCKLRNESPHFHNLITPFLDPEINHNYIFLPFQTKYFFKSFSKNF